MNADERNTVGTRRWPKLTKSRKLVLLVVLILLCGLIAAYWCCDPGKGLADSATAIVLLEDCDSDYQTPPFEDAVITFDSKGKPVPKVRDFNICETVGGCRSLSVASDGRFFVVCENVGQKLTAYGLKTGERLWSLEGDGEFTSATMSQNGMIYALTSAGTIYGKDTLVIDQQGRIAKQATIGGFDLVVDTDRNALWLVGNKVTKCDLELKVLLEVNSIRWCAVSVDLNPDGSIWVAEREHPNVGGSTNRIFQVSATGQVLKSVGLPFSPSCLRVDRSDGSVWVTGGASQPSLVRRLLDSIEKRTGRLPIEKWGLEFLTRPRVWSRTHRYDQSGAFVCEITQGGFSLAIDPADGSLWIAARDRVHHYSRQGTRLGQSDRLSSSQKYIAVIPQAPR